MVSTILYMFAAMLIFDLFSWGIPYIQWRSRFQSHSTSWISLLCRVVSSIDCHFAQMWIPLTDIAAPRYCNWAGSAYVSRFSHVPRRISHFGAVNSGWPSLVFHFPVSKILSSPSLFAFSYLLGGQLSKSKFAIRTYRNVTSWASATPRTKSIIWTIMTYAVISGTLTRLVMVHQDSEICFIDVMISSICSLTTVITVSPWS